MADLTITASAVLPGASAALAAGTAGETIVAGKAVYLASATKKWMLADADSVTAEARKAVGIALNGASLNQPVGVLTGGDVTLGAVLTAGQAIYLSDDPGGLCPLADLATGDYVCLLGLAKSTSVLTVDVQFPNVAT
ncbi:hypothetical protein [Bosea sp. LjRoot237]|uniref:hypothetical protein n=1 Tax=Bosea sp. LjRoot237 TaxID=3342292 RepID=UPI003ECCDAE9